MVLVYRKISYEKGGYIRDAVSQERLSEVMLLSAGRKPLFKNQMMIDAVNLSGVSCLPSVKYQVGFFGSVPPVMVGYVENVLADQYMHGR